uniref:Major facilitator superfamily (MFS) profile domain-containing protein n=2 Tax=Lotharella globosa TaxID=91324 RepID=A0A7S3YRR2_9EUKA
MASGDAKDKHGRPRCHSIACKWHRIHPDVVRVHGHAKWHPLKKQLEDEEGNERLPIGVALGMLGNLCAVGIPLLLWYLWSKKSSKMLHTFRSFLRMKTLMVEQPGMNGKASYKKASNAGSGKLVDPTAALAQEQIAARGHLFAAVCVVSILQGIEVAALAAFFPPAALKKGVSETMAGIIFAMRPCVQVILSPVAGRLMKNVTNQGFILVGGMGLLALVYVLFGLVENVLSGFAFTFVCFVAALIQGTVDALVNTAAFDIILALYPSEVPYRIAMKEVYDTVGYLVGTPLGGALYEAGGFMLPFTILGIGILLSSAGLYVITPSTGSHQPGSTEPDPMLDNPLKFYASFLSRRMALILAAGTVLSGASYPFLETTLTLHAQQLQLNTSFVGLLFSICNGAFLITMAAIGGHHRSGLGVGCAGLIGCALSFFLIGPTPVIPILPLSTSALTIAMVFCGVGTALAWLPMMHLLIVHLQRGNGRGNAANAAIAGVASAATSMGIVLGSFLGGLLADSFGFCWATTIWAMLFILFFIVMQTEDHRRYELHTHNGY